MLGGVGRWAAQCPRVSLQMGNATFRGCLGSCEQFAGGKCCIQHDSRDRPDWGKKEMKKRQTRGQEAG